jgi:hypothetical protein
MQLCSQSRKDIKILPQNFPSVIKEASHQKGEQKEINLSKILFNDNSF